MTHKLDFQQPAKGAYCQLDDLLNMRFIAGDLRLLFIESLMVIFIFPTVTILMSIHFLMMYQMVLAS